MKVYKYQTDLDGIAGICKCPEEEYKSFEEKTAFRFVFEDPKHPNNFCPPYKINPKRFLSKNEIEICKALGLSLYANKEEAIRFYNNLSQTFKNIHNVIGTHIAEGKVCDEDGHITDEDEITHFDLYEFEESKIDSKFKTITIL